MPLTRDFRVTIRERLERDSGFREALLEEGVQCLLAGEVDVGKSEEQRGAEYEAINPSARCLPSSSMGISSSPSRWQSS